MYVIITYSIVGVGDDEESCAAFYLSDSKICSRLGGKSSKEYCVASPVTVPMTLSIGVDCELGLVSLSVNGRELVVMVDSMPVSKNGLVPAFSLEGAKIAYCWVNNFIRIVRLYVTNPLLV